MRRTDEYGSGYAQMRRSASGFLVVCVRRIGLKAPNCTQRVYSSGSTAPGMCPPMSWLQ